MKIYGKKIPIWLIENIKVMKKWIENVRLLNGGFPNFNDNIQGSYPNLDEIYFFSDGFLSNKNFKLKGLRGALLSLALADRNCMERKDFIFKKEIIDLNSTGWTIFTLGNEWELIFKCGISRNSLLASIFFKRAYLLYANV